MLPNRSSVTVVITNVSQGGHTSRRRAHKNGSESTGLKKKNNNNRGINKILVHFIIKARDIKLQTNDRCRRSNRRRRAWCLDFKINFLPVWLGRLGKRWTDEVDNQFDNNNNKKGRFEGRRRANQNNWSPFGRNNKQAIPDFNCLIFIEPSSRIFQIQVYNKEKESRLFCFVFFVFWQDLSQRGTWKYPKHFRMS